MYLTGFAGLIRAHLYQKLHSVAGRRKAHKIEIANVYRGIVCIAMQCEKLEIAQNRSLKAKSSSSSLDNATKITDKSDLTGRFCQSELA
jgi:hypothetical protein